MTASQARPSSAERSLSRSPRSFSASGKSSGFDCPRLKSVTSWPRARAASTVARPRNFVPARRAVPDVLEPGLDVVFCGINPGRVSAAAGAHFANQRNDFWRLLHDADFTPRLMESSEQLELPRFGLGLTNAAYRTTPGSG